MNGFGDLNGQQQSELMAMIISTSQEQTVRDRAIPGEMGGIRFIASSLPGNAVGEYDTCVHANGLAYATAHAAAATASAAAADPAAADPQSDDERYQRLQRFYCINICQVAVYSADTDGTHRCWVCRVRFIFTDNYCPVSRR